LGFALLKDLRLIGVKNLSPFYKGEQLFNKVWVSTSTLEYQHYYKKKSLSKESFPKIQMNHNTYLVPTFSSNLDDPKISKQNWP
jgi:hypothetical protein